jgi:hypothetical protein
MEIQRIGFVLPVDDVAQAAGALAALLGTDATFVDGERWAQFDAAGARIALAGSDRFSDAPGLMIKVGDCDAAAERLRAAGADVSAVTAGAHERRAEVALPGGWRAMLYSSAPAPERDA